MRAKRYRAKCKHNAKVRREQILRRSYMRTMADNPAPIVKRPSRERHTLEMLAEALGCRLE